ncbi:hypothetical protein BDN72DRAFT_810844 [Pluteus cervinus]|uniref:Uncharacterized protein n=1 Tax=Pluteus cervinus TaxID=181527 RepID=A0ACD3BBT9_9AGAR|nr:hypothetical protein BDN72DRAFT_810844 [Pluteus cervinus]
MPLSHNAQRRDHLQQLFFWTVCSRAVPLVLLAHASGLALFDDSPHLDSPSKTRPPSPLLRWDTFHYLHIAKHGYVYEHEWAFFPGVPFVMRLLAQPLQYLTHLESSQNFLLSGALLAMSCDTTWTLYDLTYHHLKSLHLAYIASLLSLLPSSPTTLHLAPYAEPYFTYLAYKGLLYCAQKRWVFAALCFFFAGFFRSNSVLLSGFLLWGVLLEPALLKRAVRSQLSLSSLIRATVLISLVISPVLYHNYSAYLAFCVRSPSPASWCSNTIPSIYTHVQSTYWGSGLFNYWTIQQLPNFIMAAPPLILLFAFILWHLPRALFRLLIESSSLKDSLQHRESGLIPLFTSISLIPHSIHALVFCSVLLFSAHTQIILRLAASMPLTYWAGAWLLVQHPKYASLWIGWSVLWSVISVVLWAIFLPPA